MKYVFIICLLLVACGTPTTPTSVDAAVLIRDAARPVDEAIPAVEDATVDAMDSGEYQATYEWSSPAPIQPGFEGNICAVLGTIPTEQWLTAWHVNLSLAHHANLWFAAAGTKGDCSTLGEFVFDASQPDLHGAVPGHGAIRVPASTVLTTDVHQLNTGIDPGTVHIRFELALSNIAPIVEVFPGYLDARTISIPPQTAVTLSWSCPVPSGTGLLWMSSHTHGFTSTFVVTADGTEAYRSTTWAEPEQTVFNPPLTPAMLTWSIEARNTLATTLTFGVHRDRNEMADVYVLTTGSQPFRCTQ